MEKNYLSFVVNSPNTLLKPANNPSSVAGDINCVYYGNKFDSSSLSDKELKNHLHSLLIGENINGLSIVGFDTELDINRNVKLMQFSNRNFALLIHKDSGILSHELICGFLANTLFASAGIQAIFVGAELCSDALDVNLYGALDLTPIYSLLNDSTSNN